MSETSAAQDAIDERFKFLFDDFHTFFPAQITNVRPTGLVDVKPSLKVRFVGETSETALPTINNVPLWQLRSEGVVVRFPTEDLKGSKVGVFCADHSLVEWRAKKGVPAFPEEGRRFDINDAVAMLGFYPETLPWPTEQKAKTYEIQVKNGNKISIGDNNPLPNEQAEVLNILYNLIVNMLFGVIPATGAFVKTAEIAKLQTLLAKITNIFPIIP